MARWCANSGHFNVEIDIPALEKMATSKRETREFVDEYTMRDGRKIYLLGEGRLINLAAAEGHPAVVMDMSFADQALSVEYMVKNAKNLEAKVYPVPEDIDQNVARLKLESLGINIDTPDAGAGEVSCLLVGRHVAPKRNNERQVGNRQKAKGQKRRKNTLFFAHYLPICLCAICRLPL